MPRLENGELADQFPVDVLQGGAGTSTNMNMNEVIANRALELGGHPKGDYGFIHPNDDVNHSQSTNDTYPAACKLALIDAIGPLAKRRRNSRGRSMTSPTSTRTTSPSDAPSCRMRCR